jgi:hypothetical protein
MIKLPILILALTTISLPASATDLDWSLSGDGYHQVRKVKRKVRRKPEVRYYAAPKVEADDWRCLDKVRVVGSQWVSVDGAEESARKAWMEQVRWYSGEAFMDVAHARDYEKRCSRSSVGEAVGQTFLRCEIVARPCRPPMSAGK